MNAQLMQSIIDGSQSVTISVSAADLRSAVLAIVQQERQRIADALARNKEMPSMTRRQVAEALNVSVNTVDRWAKDGYITPIKIGTKVLYKASEIDAMLNINQAI